MKLSFCTLACPNWDLPLIADRARAYGYDGVEIRAAADGHLPPASAPAELEKTRALFADAGLAVAALSGYARLAVADGPDRDAMFAEARQLIGAAAGVGCPVVRVFGGERPKDDFAGSRARLVDALVRLAEPAAKAGVTLALESHDDWLNGAEMNEILAAATEKSGHRPGLVWDPVNAMHVQSPEDAYAEIRAWIVHTHVKWCTDGSVVRHEYRLPGEGVPDWASLARRLKADGFDGFLSFEWEKKWRPELAEPEVALPAFPPYFRALGL